MQFTTRQMSDLLWRCHLLNTTAGMTRATEGQRSQWVLFASCKKNEGKLQECWARSWNSDPSWTIDLHLLTRGFGLFPQAKRTWKEEALTACQPGFRGFVCEQRRKGRCFWCLLAAGRTGRKDVSWPLASRTTNTALTLTTKDLEVVYKHGTDSQNHSSVGLLFTDLYLKFVKQLIGYYLQYPSVVKFLV